MMALPFTAQIPGANFDLTLCAGETCIFVGANGSGKTRLASWLEDRAGAEAHRISAHRVLSLNPGVPKIGEAESRKLLRTGVNNPSLEIEEIQVPAFREGGRWQSKKATHLLNDYDALLQWLFAEQSNVALQTHNAAHAGTLIVPVRTKLQELEAIWERVLPTKNLVLKGDDLRVAPVGEREEISYSAEETSDGERAVFYMIGQVLFTKSDSILIFDEPELHVHRAILGRLWDELEAARPDCAFVLITHDLEFAASRTAAKYVLHSYSPAGGWDVGLVPEETGFDQQTTALIMGSRQPVLFVEGDGSSLDLSIYRACYPDWTILARHSCDIVIHSVQTMRSNPALHHVACAGIVDADGRDALQKINLEALGVWTLPVSEIENLFALPSVARAILKHNSFSEPGLSQQISALNAAVVADALTPQHLEEVVVRHSRRVVDTLVKRLSFENAKSEHDLIQAFAAGWAAVDVAVIAHQTRQTIQNAAAQPDMELLLELYDRKGELLNLVARHLGQQNRNGFVAWVSRVMKDADKPEIKQAIEFVLPKPIAG